MRGRVLAVVAAAAVAATLALVLPTAWATTATCAAGWSPAVAYTGGATVSHNGRNWTARWWTQNEVPGGASGVWSDQGACGPGTPGP
ncbi:MAG TPA: carbohydrate-binding protein, partial [Pilimelia sp.]|nr:carbohydrate-binding protein [Pilimelia sp.]